jgi:hypothetical protein
VQLNGAHDLQSFAFSNGASRSLIIFNLQLSSALPVTFSGANAPQGSVTIQRLTSANPTDTNETSAIVAPTTSTAASFNPATPLSLPPDSMTVLTWQTAAQPAPVVSGLTVNGITSNSAIVTWYTDQASTSQVEYGTTTAYGSTSQLDSTLVTSHSVSLANLSPSTTYNLAALSQNASGTQALSSNFTFTTLAVAPPASPVISNVQATAITSSGATITWTTTTPSNSRVIYASSMAYTSPTNPAMVTAHSVTLSGLKAGTRYSFMGQSTDASGSQASSSASVFTTLKSSGGAVISNLIVTSVWGQGASFAWSTNVASTSQIAYGTTSSLGQTGSLNSALTTGNWAGISGLSCGKQYYYQALSVDGSKNAFASAVQTFSTPACAVISNLNVTPTSGYTANVSWNTNVPATGQIVFGSSATNMQNWSSATASASTSTQISLTGLRQGTVYYYLWITDTAGTVTVSPIYTFTSQP